MDAGSAVGVSADGVDTKESAVEAEWSYLQLLLKRHFPVDLNLRHTSGAGTVHVMATCPDFEQRLHFDFPGVLESDLKPLLDLSEFEEFFDTFPKRGN